MQRTPRLLAVLALTLLILSAAPARSAEVVDRIVAVVNGEIITLFDLNERLRPVLDQFKDRQISDADKEAILKFKRDILQKLIDDILLEQEIKKFGITASDVEVENQILAFKDEHKLTEEALVEQLKLEKMTRQEFADKMRKDILRQRLLGAMVRRKVVVTSEEVARYYEEHKQDFAKDRSVHLALVLLPPGQPAAPLRERIAKGEISFAEAADAYSEGPGKGQGGDIGVLEWKSLAQEWRKALEGVAPGDMSQPFAISGREALLSLRSMDSGDAQSLSDIEKEIRDRIYSSRIQERFEEYMQELRSKAVIENKL
ncbi:MAG: SurA N-terminal domain-containing protein [Thermodesulfobacteriota bacterium]